MTRYERYGLWAALSLLVIGASAAIWSPPDAVQGEYVRIMFVHVPSAWLAFLAFGVAMAGSVIWLVKRAPLADAVAAASVSVGVFFTGLALLTGMIWGRPVWGTFWDWGDARMMTTAVMFFVYLGYLALRRSIDDPEQRARRSAVLGVVAFAQVPIVHFSVIWWRTLHQGPTLVRPDPTIDGRMLFALLVNLFAFTVIYIVLLVIQIRLSATEDALEARMLATDSTLAGAAVASPDMEVLRDA
jgi:heme exporter protein C